MNKAAYVIAQAACAKIEAMGMQAENRQLLAKGKYPIYGGTDFTDLLDKYKLHHNDVLGVLNEM